MSQTMTMAAALSGLERMQQLASAVAWTETLGRTKNIIAPLNEGGSRLPFYCVHSLSGKATDYIALARMLGPQQPLCGIQMPAKNRNAAFGGVLPSISIPAIADYYLEALLRFQPSGPLALGGWSVGTLIAFEMAQRLRALGRDVRLFVGFDMAPWNSGADTSLSHLPYLTALARNALPWATNHRLLRQKSFAAMHALLREKAVAAAAAAQNGDEPWIERYLVKDFIDAGKYPPAHLMLMQDILDVMLRYRPGRYDGNVQVYVAKTEVAFSHFPKMKAQWLAVAPRAEAMTVAGSHQNMIDEAHGEALARHLGGLLASLSDPA